MNSSTNSSLTGTLPIVVSIFIAMVLVVMKLPQSFEAWRPDWVGVVVIAWAIFVPRVCGPVFGMLAGLAVDVLMGESLGVYALIYAMLAYMANVINFKMKMFKLFQQALVVFGLTLMARFLLVFLVEVNTEIFTDWLYWAPLIVNMIIWPWVYLVICNSMYAVT
ncbi:MAG: rod shape-determining protein MreD [Arenicellaceae bacterium]|nr:rod shape-determining protein MreD [Arenicellaceae bacterium]